ncbi:hypothetical protein RUND412_008562 [Rhizina undulata]
MATTTLTPKIVSVVMDPADPGGSYYFRGGEWPTLGLQELRLSTDDITGKEITGIAKGLRKDGSWIVKSISFEPHGGWKNLKDFDKQWRSGLVALIFSATKDGKPIEVYVDSMGWSSD